MSLALAVAALGAVCPRAFAEAAPEGGATKDRSLVPEEDDFATTPYTEYGEFNDDAEEAETTKFLQYGRLFGVSLGVGYEGATGNRGALWQNGFPALDLRVHYWFDFNVSMNLQYINAPHFYETTRPSSDRFDVSLARLGIDVKYYFDTKNLSAAISFANPYVLFGVGSFSKTETSLIQGGAPDNDSAMGISAGFGLEFAIKPRKTYFYFEGKVSSVSFKDTNTSKQKNGDPNLADFGGLFYNVTGGLMFTW